MKILVQVKKWSGRTILSRLNLVQADQFWLPKLVRPNQKWSGLENRFHLLSDMYSTRHSMRLRDHANSINVSMNPSIILSVAHYMIPATLRLASKQLFCNLPFFCFGYTGNSCLNSTWITKYLANYLPYWRIKVALGSQ